MSDHLKSSEVMKRFGFTSRPGFWAFIHRSGVPHIRLNARNIVFPRAALEAWEAKRSVGCK
jgi:predicted DNA-binding transcriptional regulator AlpA